MPRKKKEPPAEMQQVAPQPEGRTTETPQTTGTTEGAAPDQPDRQVFTPTGHEVNEVRASEIIKPVDIPIGMIDFNPWNPNRMTERVFEAEMESILRYGFIDPCLVRPYPADQIAANKALEGRYQMIDGEHRIRSLERMREVGLPPGAHASLASMITKWVVPCIVQEMSDAWAKHLTLVFIETRGKGETVKVGELLASLREEMSVEDLLKGLPYGQAELDELCNIGKFDWSQFNGGDGGGGGGDGPEGDTAAKPSGFKLLVTGKDEFLGRLKEALEELRDSECPGLKWTEKR